MSLDTFYSTVMDFGLDFDYEQVAFVFDLNGMCEELSMEMLLVNDRRSITALMREESYHSNKPPVETGQGGAKTKPKPKEVVFQELGGGKKKNKQKQQQQQQQQQPQKQPQQPPQTTEIANTTQREEPPATTQLPDVSTSAPTPQSTQTEAQTTNIATNPETAQPIDDKATPTCDSTTTSTLPSPSITQPTTTTLQSESSLQPTSQPPPAQPTAWARKLQIQSQPAPPTSQLSLQTGSTSALSGPGGTSTQAPIDYSSTKNRNISALVSNHNQYTSETDRLNSIYAAGTAPQLTAPVMPKFPLNHNSSSTLATSSPINPITKTDYGYSPSYIKTGSSSATYSMFRSAGVVDPNAARQEQYMTEKLNMCLSIQELLEEQGESLELDVILTYFDQLCDFYYSTDVIDHEAEHRLLGSTNVPQGSRNWVLGLTNEGANHNQSNSNSHKTKPHSYLSSDSHFNNLIQRSEHRWSRMKGHRTDQRGQTTPNYKLDYDQQSLTSTKDTPRKLFANSSSLYHMHPSFESDSKANVGFVKERKVINGLAQSAKKVMSYYSTFLKHSATSSHHSQNSRNSHSSQNSGGNTNFVFLDNVSTHSRDSKGSKGSKRSKSSKDGSVADNIAKIASSGANTPAMSHHDDIECDDLHEAYDSVDELPAIQQPLIVERASEFHTTSAIRETTSSTAPSTPTSTPLDSTSLMIPSQSLHLPPTTPTSPYPKAKATPGKKKNISLDAFLLLDSPSKPQSSSKHTKAFKTGSNYNDNNTNGQTSNENTQFSTTADATWDENDPDGEYWSDDDTFERFGEATAKHGVNRFLQSKKPTTPTTPIPPSPLTPAGPESTPTTAPIQPTSLATNQSDTKLSPGGKTPNRPQASQPAADDFDWNAYYSDDEHDYGGSGANGAGRGSGRNGLKAAKGGKLGLTDAVDDTYAYNDADESDDSDGMIDYDENGNPILPPSDDELEHDPHDADSTKMLEFEDSHFLGKGSKNKQNRYKKKDKQFILKKSKQEKFAPSGSLTTTPLATHGSAGKPGVPSKLEMFTIVDKDGKAVTDARPPDDPNVKTVISGSTPTPSSSHTPGNDCIMMLMDEIVNTPNGDRRFNGKIMFPLHEFFDFTLEQLQTMKYEELTHRKLRQEQDEACDAITVTSKLLKNHHYEYTFVDLFSSLSNDLTQGILAYLNPVEIHIALEFLDEQQFECEEAQNTIEKYQHRYTDQCLKVQFPDPVDDGTANQPPDGAHGQDINQKSSILVEKEKEDLVMTIQDDFTPIYNYFSALQRNYRSFQRSILKYCISVTSLSFSSTLFPKDIFSPVSIPPGPYHATSPQDLVLLEAKRRDVTMGIKKTAKEQAALEAKNAKAKEKGKGAGKDQFQPKFDPLTSALVSSKKGKGGAGSTNIDQGGSGKDGKAGGNDSNSAPVPPSKQYAPFYEYLSLLPIESKLHYYQPIQSDLAIYTSPLCLPYILSLFPNVTHLTLDNCAPRHEDDLLTLFDYFPSNLTSLTLINVSFEPCWSDFSRTLSTLPVTHLHFDHCGLTDDSIKGLQSCLQHLIELTISHSKNLTDRTLSLLLQSGIDILRFTKCNRFTANPFAQLPFISNKLANNKAPRPHDHVGIDYFPHFSNPTTKPSTDGSKSTNMLLDGNGNPKIYKRGYLHTLELASCSEIKYFCFASSVLQNLILSKLQLKTVYLIAQNLRFLDCSENISLKRLSLFAPLLHTAVLKNNPGLRSFTSNVLPSFSPRDVILPALTQNIYSTVTQAMKSDHSDPNSPHDSDNEAASMNNHDLFTEINNQDVTTFAPTTTTTTTINDSSSSHNMLESKYFLPFKYNALQLNPTTWSVPTIFDISKSILQSSLMLRCAQQQHASSKSFYIGAEIADDINVPIANVPTNIVFGICTSDSTYLDKPRSYSILSQDKYHGLMKAFSLYAHHGPDEPVSTTSHSTVRMLNKPQPKAPKTARDAEVAEQAFNSMLSVLNNEKNNLSAFISPKMHLGGSYFRSRAEELNSTAQSLTEVQFLDEDNPSAYYEDEFEEEDTSSRHMRYDPNAHLTQHSIHMATGGTGFYRRSNLHQTHTAHYIAVPKHRVKLFEMIGQGRVLLPAIFALTIKSLTNAIAVWYNNIVSFADYDDGNENQAAHRDALLLLPDNAARAQHTKPSIYNYFNNPHTRSRMDKRVNYAFDQIDDDNDTAVRGADDSQMDFDDLDDFAAVDDTFGGLFDFGSQTQGHIDYDGLFQSFLSTKTSLSDPQASDADVDNTIASDELNPTNAVANAPKKQKTANVIVKLSNFVEEMERAIVDSFLPSLKYLDVSGSNRVSRRHMQHFVNCNNHLSSFFSQTPTAAFNSTQLPENPLVIVGFDPLAVPNPFAPLDPPRSIFTNNQPLTQSQYLKGHFILFPSSLSIKPTQTNTPQQSLAAPKAQQQQQQQQHHQQQQQQQKQQPKSILKGSTTITTTPSATAPLPSTHHTSSTSNLILPPLSVTPSVATTTTTLSSLDGGKPILRHHPKSQLQSAPAQKIIPPLSIASRVAVNLATTRHSTLSHDFLAYQSLFLNGDW